MAGQLHQRVAPDPPMPVAPRPHRGTFAAANVPFCVIGVPGSRTPCSRAPCCPQPWPCPCTPVLGFLGEEGDSQSGPKSLTGLMGPFLTLAVFSPKSHAALPATRPGRGDRKKNKDPKAAPSSEGLQRGLRSSLSPPGQRHPRGASAGPAEPSSALGIAPSPPAGHCCFLLNWFSWF